jgi:hypothetical protein
MSDEPLNAAQEAHAQAVYERIKEAFDSEARRLARLMAGKDDAHLLGDTEFQVRDRIHELGARLLETALNERKKGGTEVPARPAPSAAIRPLASVCGKKPS